MYDTTGYVVNWTVEAARRAIGVYAASLVGLLSDPAPAIRRNCAFALAVARPADVFIVDALRGRLSEESDPATQISLVLAAAQHSGQFRAGDSVPAWLEALYPDPDAAIPIRLAAMIAWLCRTTAPVPPTELINPLITPRTSEHLREVPWLIHLESEQVTNWLAALFHDPARNSSPPPELWPAIEDPWANIEHATTTAPPNNHDGHTNPTQHGTC